MYVFLCMQSHVGIKVLGSDKSRVLVTAPRLPTVAPGAGGWVAGRERENMIINIYICVIDERGSFWV